MNYTPNTWVNGAGIPASKLNKMEQGILAANGTLLVNNGNGTATLTLKSATDGTVTSTTFNTTAAQTQKVNIYSTQTPGTVNANDGQAVTVGNRFTSDTAGNVTGILMYRATTAPASAVGLLFSSTGTELARATFGTLSVGWNTATFATPVAISAGTTYKAAYWTSSSYVASSGLLPFSNGHFTVDAGYYDYGASPVNPSQGSTALFFADVALSIGAAVVVPGGGAAVTHGEQLTINHVGPWTLQASTKGAETLTTPALPSRGYWLMDTPSEWAPTTPYVYNNNPSNTGGVVPAGGLTIDGYAVPAGTIVAQYRNFSASDFSAQGQAGQYLFRGCRFRNAAVGQSSQFNDYTATYTNRMFYCDMGSTGPTDAEWQGAFWKAIGGTGHIVHRNYFSYQYVTFQPNVPNCQFNENFVENLVYYGGEAGPSGNGGPLHMACIGSEGNGTGYRVMRNRIVPQSPDAGGHTFLNGSSIAFEGTAGGAYTNCQVVDNYLSGFNYVILDFGEVAGSTGVVVTGNKVTTRYFTNGGASGCEQVGPNPPAWGSNGNVKSGNVWADDYGTGGTGSGTALSARQYPTGNGPRAGAVAF